MLVITADASEGRRQLTESTSPRAQAVAKNAERVTGAAQGVTTGTLVIIGMVIDGVKESSDAGTGLPPRFQQRPGAPEQHPAAVEAKSFQQTLGRQVAFTW